jgi:hypothetical protein
LVLVATSDAATPQGYAGNSVSEKAARAKELEELAKRREQLRDAAYDRWSAATSANVPYFTTEERRKKDQEVKVATEALDQARKDASLAREVADGARKDAEKASEEARDAANRQALREEAEQASRKAQAAKQAQEKQVYGTGAAAVAQDSTSKPAELSRGGQVLGWIIAIGVVVLVLLWILWKLAGVVILIMAGFCKAFGIRRWPGLIDLAERIADEQQRARQAKAGSSSGMSKTSIYSVAGLGWYELRKQSDEAKKQTEELRQQTRLMEERNRELRRKH